MEILPIPKTYFRDYSKELFGAAKVKKLFIIKIGFYNFSNIYFNK